MKTLIVALALLFSLMASAQEIKSTSSGTVEKAECQLVAKDNSVVGATVGGTAGAVAGGMLGKAVFGKSGGWIGGLAGGALGGAVGNEMGATETFTCKLIVRSAESIHLLETVVNKKPMVGSSVTVLEMVDGSKKIL